MIKLDKINFSLKLTSSYIPNVIITLLDRVYTKIVPSKSDSIFYNYKKIMMESIGNSEKKIIENSTIKKDKVIYFRSCLSSTNSDLKPFFDSIKPNKEIASKISDFANINFSNKKVIGVHVRYYNKNLVKSDHSQYWEDEDLCLQQIKGKIQEAINKVKGFDYVIFLATDSSLPFNFIKKNFPNIVSVHKDFGQNVVNELHVELPQQTAVATLVEMFLLAKSNILVRTPSESWFSHYASLYVDDIIA